MGPEYSASLNTSQGLRLLSIGSASLCNCGMTHAYPTVAEMRRANLKTLVDSAGGQAAVAARLDVTPAQINQWIKASPDSKTGKPRTIGDDSARRLETLFERPPGWMDHDHSRDQAAGPAQPSATTLPQALERLGVALAAGLPDDVRQDAADLLAKLAHRRGAERHQGELLALLQAPPGKRQANG